MKEKVGIIILRFILVIVLIHNKTWGADLPDADLNKETDYVILSVDGGGIRGIIAARILQEIEERTAKPIYTLFDLMVGSSTGGLIILGLNTPGVENRVKYTAKDLVEFYKNNGKGIFHRSLFRKAYTGFGLWGAKYDRSSLDALLNKLFGDEMLSNTITPTMIISYSISKGDVHLWSSGIAKTNAKHNFYLRDVAGAISAAPTYFEPKKLISIDGTKTYYEADGGIFADNPATMAIAQAYRLNPSINKNNILLISLGTGKVKLTKTFSQIRDSGVVGWVLRANLIDVMMNTSSEISEWQSSMLNLDTVRIQISLDEHLGEMDNISEENINALLKVAEDYIKENNDMINKLCQKLIDHHQTRHIIN